MSESLAVSLTKELIKTESTDPGTYESMIKDWIKSWFLNLEKQVLSTSPALHGPLIHISEEEVLPGRFNLMAELPLHLYGSAIWIPLLQETVGHCLLLMQKNRTDAFTAAVPAI